MEQYVILMEQKKMALDEVKLEYIYEKNLNEKV